MGSGVPVASIDETGLHVPEFNDVLNGITGEYKDIYGQDAYLGNDSQDGQFLGLLATVVNDIDSAIEQTYNAFSPATARGIGLSSVVKVNGIKRHRPTFSTCDVQVVGQAGRQITNPQARDENNVLWNLPDFTLPAAGELTVTATCTVEGAISAPAGLINSIANPQIGWQSIINLFDATVGDPVENNAQLRRRQTISTEIPSLGLIEGLQGALAELLNVRSVKIYENNTDAPDANGIPGHCIAIVIDGGDEATIAHVIAAKKGGGVGTYGNEVQDVTNSFGLTRQIAFWRPTNVPITYVVKVKGLRGFTMNKEREIGQSLVDWTNNLDLGESVFVERTKVPAQLYMGPGSNTFELLEVRIARDGFATTANDIPIAFNERAFSHINFVQFQFPPGG